MQLVTGLFTRTDQHWWTEIGVYCELQVQQWGRDNGASGQRRHGANNDAIAAANRKLLLVPVVFIFLRIWGTLRFVINAHFLRDVDGNAMEWIVPLQVRIQYFLLSS